MMKKFLLIPLVILFLGALFFSVRIPAPAAQPKAEVPKEIRVGDCASLTGMFAAFGEGGVFGMKAAADDMNKQGGVYVKEYGAKLPVKVIVPNNESDPIKTGTLAEELVLRDKVHVFAGPIRPPPMNAPIAAIAERYKIPFVAANPLEPWQGMRTAVTPPWKYSWMFGFAIATPAPPGDFRHGKPGYTIADTWKAYLDMFGDKTNKRAGVFASDEPDGIGWYNSFPAMLKKWGYHVLGDERKLGLAPLETTDFSPMIKEWMKDKVEILWGNAPAPWFGTLWRQAYALGFKPKMVAAARAALFYDDVASWGGDLPNGIGIEIWWDPTFKGCPGIGNTTPKTLFERWRKEKGKPLNPNIGMGYTAMQIVFDAIERAGTLDGEKVNMAIGKTDMMTISHRIVFDPETQFSRNPLVFGQWFKKDAPEKWELKVVFSKHEFIPAAGKPIFPRPYR
jgi:branched-chain amino acid transport system substrate-binding protein